jgi:carboxyl-terminal processing protease
MQMRWTALLLAALLAACGGGGGDGGGTSFTPGGGNCSVASQKQFVLDVARDWYLFPELLPANVNPASYSTAQALLDAITATARAQGKDRFFSYLTTRQEDAAFFGEGEFIGFGFRSRIDGSRLFLIDVFEATPAFEGGLRRGAEILAIDSGSGYVSMANVLASDPNLEGAFGSADVGVRRGFRYLLDGVITEVTLSKRLNTITPISPNGGVRVLSLPANPSVQVGYVALRSYISTAQSPLLGAFADFRSRGIDYFIIDLRYNGGGLVSISDLLGDLFGANRAPTDIYSGLRFNNARRSNDSTRFFQPRAESVAPVRIAFITTGATASASEMTINSMDAWAEVAIIGTDTFGKPVGQSAFDQPGCDTRLRLVTFRTVNARERGDYFNGLASELAFACTAADDLGRPMGDPLESSTAAALGWIQNGACPTALAAASGGLQKLAPVAAQRYPLPARPAPAQAWLPGLF